MKRAANVNYCFTSMPFTTLGTSAPTPVIMLHCIQSSDISHTTTTRVRKSYDTAFDYQLFGIVLEYIQYLQKNFNIPSSAINLQHEHSFSYLHEAWFYVVLLTLSNPKVAAKH